MLLPQAPLPPVQFPEQGKRCVLSTWLVSLGKDRDLHAGRLPFKEIALRPILLIFPGASFKHSDCTLGHSSQSDKNNLNIAHKKAKGMGLFFSFKCITKILRSTTIGTN